MGKTIVGLSTFGRLLDSQLLWNLPKIHYSMTAELKVIHKLLLGLLLASGTSGP